MHITMVMRGGGMAAENIEVGGGKIIEMHNKYS